MTAPDPAAADGGDSDRHIELASCFNFRDMGGLVTTDGRVVRRGVFFRSDDLVRLTAEELSTLRAMGIRTVVDLRTADEVDRRGSVRCVPRNARSSQTAPIRSVPSRDATHPQPQTNLGDAGRENDSLEPFGPTSRPPRFASSWPPRSICLSRRS